MENVENQTSEIIEEQKEEQLTSEEVNKTYESETPSEKEGGYFGYYIFVAVSAIIGFVIVFFAMRIFLIKAVENGNEFIAANRSLISVFASLIAVILFMLISLVFKKILKKIFLSEIFLYLYIGFLTTAIHTIVFNLTNVKLSEAITVENLNWILAEAIGFTVSTLFAFFADKTIVFKSLNFMPIKVISEFAIFYSGRLASLGIKMVLMAVIIMILKNHIAEAKTCEFYADLSTSVVAIILNYLLSKFIIFKKVKKIEEKEIGNEEQV